MGEDGWEDDEKWVFAITESGSSDVIAQQVPSNRSRKDLLPIIKKHCKEGTFFCSDGRKVYDNLEMNHSANYVDPETGHTQTIEGFWRQCKAKLPSFGLKPKYLVIYIGSFCWCRYCKQRNLDFFIHLLSCIAEKRSFVEYNLPISTMTKCDKEVCSK